MTSPPGTTPTTQNRITGTGTKAERAVHRLVRAMKRQGIPPRSATVRALLPVLVAEDTDDWSDADFRDFLDRLMRELPLGLARKSKAARHGRDYRPRNERGELVTA